jgi:hypothetical protein
MGCALLRLVVMANAAALIVAAAITSRLVLIGPSWQGMRLNDFCNAPF